MEPNHRQTTIWTQLLLFIVVLLTSSIQMVHSGCRIQDRNACENVCQWNVTRKSYDCVLRVIVILTKEDKVETSLNRVINDTFIEYKHVAVFFNSYCGHYTVFIMYGCLIS